MYTAIKIIDKDILKTLEMTDNVCVCARACEGGGEKVFFTTFQLSELCYTEYGPTVFKNSVRKKRAWSKREKA